MSDERKSLSDWENKDLSKDLDRSRKRLLKLEAEVDDLRRWIAEVESCDHTNRDDEGGYMDVGIVRCLDCGFTWTY